MRTVTISSKYQVVIPREIREQLNLRPGGRGEASAGYIGLHTRTTLADASPRRANRYRQMEADEPYDEKPEVTLERLVRLEQVMADEIVALGLMLDGRDAG